jgi:AcrR family transcriptional regulator
MAKSSTKRFNRADWLHQALEVLATQGPAKLNIQNLCQALGVSRGSFYWHFDNRQAFTLALLEMWHEEYSESATKFIEAGGGSGREKFNRLVLAIFEQRLTRFDLPIRSWAMQEPEIAELVRRTDRFRLNYVRKLFGEMGFQGRELDARARTALAALTMQENLMDDSPARPLPPATNAKLMTKILCGD